MPRHARRLKSFATSEYGQGYAAMLQKYGKTADEWGRLPPEVRYFHEAAWNEQQRRADEEINEKVSR